MVVTPRIGRSFVEWAGAPGDRTLGLVDFSIFLHRNYPNWPDNTMADAEKWALEIAGPAYAIDSATAISVVDGNVTVVSEGEWQQIA